MRILRVTVHYGILPLFCTTMIFILQYGPIVTSSYWSVDTIDWQDRHRTSHKTYTNNLSTFRSHFFAHSLNDDTSDISFHMRGDGQTQVSVKKKKAIFSIRYQGGYFGLDHSGTVFSTSEPLSKNIPALYVSDTKDDIFHPLYFKQVVDMHTYLSDKIDVMSYTYRDQDGFTLHLRNHSEILIGFPPFPNTAHTILRIYDSLESSLVHRVDMAFSGKAIILLTNEERQI